MSTVSLLLTALLAVILMLSALVSIYSFRYASESRKQMLRGKGNSRLYYDEDGSATHQTQDFFAKLTHSNNAAILTATLAGFAVAMMRAVVAVTLDFQAPVLLDRSEMIHIGLNLCAVIFLVFQSMVVTFTPSGVERYRQGIFVGVCSFLIFFANTGHFFTTFQDNVASTTSHILLFIHLVLLLTSTLVSLALPRRPDVFQPDQSARPVDGQRTVSVLCRYTLSWATPLLSFAKCKGRLDLSDLPFLDGRTLSRPLALRLHSLGTVPLWKNIFRTHRSILIQQWTLTLVQTFVTIALQYSMFRLIQNLEQNCTTPHPKIWAWVAILAVSVLVQQWIETWLLWIGWCHIAVPIQVQLSALIVQKSIKKKDARFVGRKCRDPEPVVTEHPEPTNESERLNHEGALGMAVESPKNEQDQINLMGIDTQRIAELSSYNNIFFATLLGLINSLGFLFFLVGWEGVVVSLIGICLTLPLNLFATQRYAATQSQLMDARDSKTATLTEAFQGIRQIKFDALESQWWSKIRAIRTTELLQLWNAFCAESLLRLCWIAGPSMIAAITLSSYALFKGHLLPSVAFTALTIFRGLEVTLSIVPHAIIDWTQARISFGRIEAFLNSPERVDLTVDADVIAFKGASIAWPRDEDVSERFVLQVDQIVIPRNELSVIAGPTGAGKSLLLAAIIGEADILSGIIHRPKWHLDSDNVSITEVVTVDWIIPKTMAFVAQDPWIENASLRENVLFGLPFSADRYNKVLQACALTQDIALMLDGDRTEVGAHGVTLSGGQCSRLSLARALYSRAEILVLDDVFSDVDTRVGRQILEQALVGELSENRTRIIATHQVRLCLPKAEFVILLGNAGVEYAGPPSGLLHNLVLTDAGDTEPNTDHGLDPQNVQDIDFTLRSKTLIDKFGNRQFVMTTVDDNFQQDPNAEVDKVAKRADPGRLRGILVPEERRERGAGTWLIYKKYLKAVSSWPWAYWLFVLGVLVAFELALFSRTWWVKVWSENSVREGSSSYSNIPITVSSRISPQIFLDANSLYVIKHNTTRGDTMTAGDDDMLFYIAVYFCITALFSLLGAFKYIWIYYGSVRASHVLFEDVTLAVLHAPLRWFDTMPVGRLINRFTTDFNVVDSRIAVDFIDLFYHWFQFLGIFAAGVIVSPSLLLCAVPLLAICVAFAKQYLAGAREVKRLASTSISPIFDQLESIVSGLSTIRASQQSSRYVHRMFMNIDTHACCVWHMWLFNRWLGIRFSVVGVIFTTIVASFAVYSPRVSASLAGLALAFALDFSRSLFWALRHYAETELDMNSMERIAEFAALAVEEKSGSTTTALPANWPDKGLVEISDLTVGYASNLPPVLEGVTIRCRPGSRTAIVGRTGAGKSSLMQALFRFVEARTGSILIDGMDISTLPLAELRRGIAIVPQDPVLWSGSVRDNLDPLGVHEDSKLWDLLEAVQLHRRPTHPPSLYQRSSSPPLGAAKVMSHVFNLTLTDILAPNAHNLSHGQRQLLCLARVLLAQPTILVLDEATSAVDHATEVIIRRIIRAWLPNCTMLVVAHRMSAVVGSDQVVVLEAGKVVEVGSPKDLWDMRGTFSDLVRGSGDDNLLTELLEGGSEP